jgi:hypothetical protein
VQVFKQFLVMTVMDKRLLLFAFLLSNARLEGVSKGSKCAGPSFPLMAVLGQYGPPLNDEGHLRSSGAIRGVEVTVSWLALK